jgi:hypothetical protein
VERALGTVPALLSSKTHVLFLAGLLIGIVIVPLAAAVMGLRNPVSADLELILGNWTNVTSALGASIAAGASVSAHHHAKQAHKHAAIAAAQTEQP